MGKVVGISIHNINILKVITLRTNSQYYGCRLLAANC
jgi:hypothetical protein